MRHRNIVTALIAAAAFSVAAMADCNDPRNQHEMNRCAAASYAAADADLNAAYAKLMKAIEDKTMRDRLRDAQRAWIRYRDSQCALDAAENEGGSMYPLVHAGCLARMTKERLRQLHKRLACQRDPATCDE